MEGGNLENRLERYEDNVYHEDGSSTSVRNVDTARICPITWHYIPKDITPNIKRFVKHEGGWC